MSEQGEMTLRELFLLAGDYLKQLWQRKWWIIAAAIVMAAVFVLRDSFTPKQYTAKLTYMLNEDDGSAGGGVAAMLNQFGFGGAAGEYNLDKVLELSRSKRIIQQALLDSIQDVAEPQLIANAILDTYNYDQSWPEQPDLRGLRFTSDSIAGFDLNERKVLNALYHHVIGSGKKKALMTNDYSQNTSILTLTTKSSSEPLSLALCESLYDQLSQFYIDQATEKSRFTKNQLQAKTDSIKLELQSTEAQLARFMDRSQALLLQQDQVQKSRLTRKVQLLTIMYGESIKNLETASFLLDNSTPFFVAIDRPYRPLKSKQSGIVIPLIKGGLIGAIGATFILVLVIFFRQVMRAE